jgi:hypothetical protein
MRNSFGVLDISASFEEFRLQNQHDGLKYSRRPIGPESGIIMGVACSLANSTSGGATTDYERTRIG